MGAFYVKIMIPHNKNGIVILNMVWLSQLQACFLSIPHTLSYTSPTLSFTSPTLSLLLPH